MEFLLVALIVLIPLALAVGGIALIANALESIRETKRKYGKKNN
jgi:hypothetical protein